MVVPWSPAERRAPLRVPHPSLDEDDRHRPL